MTEQEQLKEISRYERIRNLATAIARGTVDKYENKSKYFLELIKGNYFLSDLYFFSSKVKVGEISLSQLIHKFVFSSSTGELLYTENYPYIRGRQYTGMYDILNDGLEKPCINFSRVSRADEELKYKLEGEYHAVEGEDRFQIQTFPTSDQPQSAVTYTYTLAEYDSVLHLVPATKVIGDNVVEQFQFAESIEPPPCAIPMGLFLSTVIDTDGTKVVIEESGWPKVISDQDIHEIDKI